LHGHPVGTGRAQLKGLIQHEWDREYRSYTDIIITKKRKTYPVPWLIEYLWVKVIEMQRRNEAHHDHGIKAGKRGQRTEQQNDQTTTLDCLNGPCEKVGCQCLEVLNHQQQQKKIQQQASQGDNPNCKESEA
jgi:hypothetical protein